MSSRRFPGKVLAPFRGRPAIDHVIENVRVALAEAPVVVATSTEVSDDPLAHHLAARGVPCVRGPLDDVVARFIAAVEAHPCDAAVRICADSPLLPPSMVARVVREAREAWPFDLVTTTAPRTFPKGINVEILRVSTLRALGEEPLTSEDREHLTRYLHRHPDRYRIANVRSNDPTAVELDLALDTLADLERLEHLDPDILARLAEVTG